MCDTLVGNELAIFTPRGWPFPRGSRRAPNGRALCDRLTPLEVMNRSPVLALRAEDGRRVFGAVVVGVDHRYRSGP